MPRVFLHTKGLATGAEWENCPRDFARVPCVGEYVTTAGDSPMHRVVLVIHCASSADDPADYAAEVYAVQDVRPQHEIIQTAEAGGS